MDKKLVGPLVLIVLIVGSMVVPWVTHALKPAGNHTTPSETPVPGETPADNSKVAFFAQGVDANIQELSQVYPLQGYTDKTNLATMIESIQRLESVSRVLNPKFGNPERGRERFMPFSAEIVPSRDSNIEEVKRELVENSILSDVVAFRKAIVKLPVHIKVKSLKQDLNLSRDVSLEEPFASCIVVTNALVGDQLKVTLYLQMAGQRVLKETLQSSMEEDLSMQPKYHKAEFETSIARVENYLGFEELFPYNGFDRNNLKQSLLGVNGVETADFKLLLRESSFEVKMPLSGSEDANKLKKDLNAVLLPLPGVEKVSFALDENKLSAHAAFKQEAYATVRSGALKALKSTFPDSNFEFVDPKASIQGSVGFSADASAEEIAKNSHVVFQLFGLKPVIWQNTFFDANFLPATDGNFSVPEGQQEMPLRAKPGSKPGDAVKVNVYFSTIRGKITPEMQARTELVSYLSKTK